MYDTSVILEFGIISIAVTTHMCPFQAISVIPPGKFMSVVAFIQVCPSLLAMMKFSLVKVGEPPPAK
jgi:hypothetical protein